MPALGNHPANWLCFQYRLWLRISSCLEVEAGSFSGTMTSPLALEFQLERLYSAEDWEKAS
jgi:hypothetical protein